MHIAWIDDDRFFISNLVKHVEESGIKVTTFDRVDKAYERIKLGWNDFDKILVDIMIQVSGDFDPDKCLYGRRTGVELIRRMIQDKSDLEARRKFLVVTITSDPDVIRFLNERGIRFLQKQLSPPEEIVSQLRSK